MVCSVVIMFILLLEWRLLDGGLLDDVCAVRVWLGIGYLVVGFSADYLLFCFVMVFDFVVCFVLL